MAECEYCFEEIYDKPYKRNNMLFCSEECADAYDEQADSEDDFEDE